MFKRGPFVLWADRSGRVWRVQWITYDGAIEWNARLASRRAILKASASVTVGSGALRRMARLDDIRVDEEVENQGVGSRLLSEIITTCRKRGHVGIEGELSIVDSDHFDKLTHFYEKFGFTVTFHSPYHPDYNPKRPGDIRLVF